MTKYTGRPSAELALGAILLGLLNWTVRWQRQGPDGCRYLLHDRDAKFCSAFAGILEAVGIKAIKLPPRSPNLNANLERWHRSVKEECLSKLILFGEASLRQVLSHYVDHFHRERNHQGKGNVILFPMPADRIGELTGEIQTRERLGGMLKFYYRRAA